MGVIEPSNSDGRVRRFAYKPDDPPSDVVTMEVFAYRPSALLDTLEALDEREDFGDELLPRLVENGRAYEHRFDRYWRDVGTPAAYWQAHQDVLAGRLDLDDPSWPIRTTAAHRPPARIESTARVENSLLSPACRVAGEVRSTVLSPGVVIEEGAAVSGSVLFGNVTVRSGAKVDNAIIDAGMVIEGGRIVAGTPDDPAIIAPSAG